MPNFNKSILALKLAKLHTAVFLAVAHYVAAVSEFEDNLLANKGRREELEKAALKARERLVRQMTNMRMVIQQFGKPGPTAAEQTGSKGLNAMYNGFRNDLLDTDATFEAARTIAQAAN